MSALALITLAGTGAAQPSPTGPWRTIDDATGKPRAPVRVVQVDGRLSGQIEKLLTAPREDPDPKCDKCNG